MRNRSFKRKTRNVVLLIVLLAIVFGIYYNVINSRAEKVYEVAGLAIDNYGYLDDEAFILEAKQTAEGSYQIELPESVNTKKINEIYNAFLADLGTQITEEQEEAEENTEQEQTETPEETTELEQAEDTENIENLEGKEPTEQEQIVENTNENTEETEQLEKIEIIDNKITLSKEQMETKKVVLELSYDMAILTTTEQGKHHKELLATKTEEERNEIQLTEATQILYNKVMKYEDAENAKLVELRGYLPRNAELKVEPVTQEKLTEIFGDAKIDVAYDIKIITKIPKIEINENGEEIEIYETKEINPEDLGEKCKVSIKDTNISEDSQVVHVKEDNTYEQLKVKESTEESISFEAETFSIYAVTSDPSIVEIVSAGVAAGTVVTAGTLTADDYGAYVSNYVASNGSNEDLGIGGWRIFHTDGENIYLIADHYVKNTYIPTGKGGTLVNTDGVDSTYYDPAYCFIMTDIVEGTDYTGIGDISSTLKNKLLSQYVTYENTNASGKATAYLLDTNQWSGFGNVYTDFAIGGPTLELFTASYNATHEIDIDTRVVDNGSGYGYELKWSNSDYWDDYWLDFVFQGDDWIDEDVYNYPENLYIITDPDIVNEYWLPSPSAETRWRKYVCSDL